MDQLKEMRMQVDAIDKGIVALFEKRMSLSEQISREKIRSGDRIYNREREEKKISGLMEEASTKQNRHFVRDLYAQVLSLERKRQYQLAQEAGATGKLPFIQVDSLSEGEKPRVVFQGTEGAYSHAAMCRFFGDDVNGFHVRKFRDAMEAIADGAADYAVLPIENSTAGIVADNFDLLVDFENYIVGQQVIKCEHVLMGLPGTALEEIDTVYSHQQALSQCDQFLESHPGWSAVPYDNTALAARKVAQEGIRSHAAIGSAFAAERFGLEILAEHIYHNEANSTRFIIATNQRIFLKGSNKISICFEGKHSSGSLYNILSHIIYNDLNMSLIESRPIPGRNWEYRFFVDFEGNLNDSSVRNALRGIRMDASNMKILGNYPA